MNALEREFIGQARNKFARLSGENQDLREQIEALEVRLTEIRGQLAKTQVALAKTRKSREFYRHRSLELVKKSAT